MKPRFKRMIEQEAAWLREDRPYLQEDVVLAKAIRAVGKILAELIADAVSTGLEHGFDEPLSELCPDEWIEQYRFCDRMFDWLLE